MIRSDELFVRICWGWYLFVGASAVVATLLLLYKKFSPLQSLNGMLLTGVAMPLALKHMQRLGARIILQGLREDCADPALNQGECERIAENVDNMLRSRGAI